jgi:hypothetical protein
MVLGSSIPLGKISASAYTIPTDKPEADGTYSWNSTTMVAVEVSAGDQCGLGYTYTDKSAVSLIKS